MHINRSLTVIVIALLALFAVSCATTVEKRQTKWTPSQLSKQRSTDFDVPIVVNDRVIAWIDYFQGPGRGHFARYLQRSGRYVPEMQLILKKLGMPQDLVYIALIESGFSGRAYSRAKASGHWQFISGTGKMYGLDINSWVDERRDFEKSTIAAARFLKDLYNTFGDWYLAMAAYNAGPGKISKAVSMTGTNDFWEMIDRDRRHYIRAETRDYVPKFIAAAIIAKSPEKFGFSDVVYDEPIEIEHVRIPSQTDVQVIARCADLPVDVVADLNMELVRGVTPPGARDYKIKLPHGRAKQFEMAYAEVPESERVLMVMHTVRRGESAGSIARKYGVSVRELLAANDIKKAKGIKRGMTLTVPKGGAFESVAKGIDIADSSDANDTPAAKRKGLIKYRVKRGETLGKVASRFGVSVTDIKRWNQIGGKSVRQGQLLKIYAGDTMVASSRGKGEKVSSGSSHVIRRGDSWWKVAQKYGISINDLKEWNPDMASRDLVAGKKLRLFASNDKPVKAQNVASDVAMTPRPEAAKNMSTESDLLAMQGSPTGDLSDTGLPVPEKSAKVLRPKAEKAGASTVKYRVKRGDTLDKIAKNHGVSVNDILDWNNLSKGSARSLKAGQVIKLQASR